MSKKEELRTVHLKFSEEEIEDIDLWREKYHIRTRSEAIRQMIRRTLEAENVNDDKQGLEEKRPSDFTPSTQQKQSTDGQKDLVDRIQSLVKEEVQKALLEMRDKPTNNR